MSNSLFQNLGEILSAHLFSCREQVFFQFNCVGVLRELILRWVGFTVHVCPCGETERGDRAVDVTPGYDLNTCLLRLGCDQSSLCQPPLPAGNFSMHETPPHPTPPKSLTFFSFCSSFSASPLFVFFFNINFLSISRSNLPSLRSSAGLPCSRVTHLLYLAMLPSLFTFPLSAFSHIISPGLLVLSISLAVILPEDIMKRNKGRGGKGQMEMNEDCRRTQNTNPAVRCTSIQFFYALFFLDITDHYCFHSCHDFIFLINAVVFLTFTHGL